MPTEPALVLERRRRFDVLCLALALVIASCGGGGEERATESNRKEEAGMVSKTAPPRFERTRLGDVELEWEVRGAPDGEPVLFVHGALVADWFAPLLDQPVLADRYRLIHYHGAGYAGSSPPAGPLSIGDQAAHARALLRRLGVDRAHVVGHSLGANVALQLALDAPEVVHSLALVEPARPLADADPQIGLALERFRAGDRAGAVDAFSRAVFGPGYRETIERALPGALAQAEADADTFFGVELPSLQQYSFRAEDAARVTQPVLLVLGGDTPTVRPVFKERHELLLSWLPKAEGFVLPGTTHLMTLQDPVALAAALAAFFGRHPLTATG